MVLQDVNGNGKRSSAAERWLRQRGVQRTSVVRCVFGPPEKRDTMAIIANHEAEMDRKRKEFVARYEPLGMTPAERCNFFENMIKTPSSSPTMSHGSRNADYSSAKNAKIDHQHLQNKQQDRHQKHGGQQSSDEDRRN